MPRHTYTDPDYAYDDEEDAKIKEHKQKYIDYLRKGAVDRKESTQFKWAPINRIKFIRLTPGYFRQRIHAPQ